MIIAYDARPLRKKYWGVAVVVTNLCSRLTPRYSFTGLSPRYEAFSREDLTTWPSLPMLNMAMFEASVLLTRQYDLYWGTNHVIPELCRSPAIVTVHDLSLLAYSKGHPVPKYQAWRMASSIKRARAIVTVSQTTADDLIAIMPELKSRVEVALNGFELPRGELDEPCEAQEESPYMVMLGAHGLRKNLALAAASVLRAAGGRDLRLLVTGDVHPSFSDIIHRYRNVVELVGVLPKEKLFNLVRRAVGLVYPSRYEGFGFPMLEAMAVGCPVLALDTPISREIGGNAAWFLPEDSACWATAIQELRRNPTRRLEMQHLGRENTKRFSWDRTAEVYSQVFDHSA